MEPKYVKVGYTEKWMDKGLVQGGAVLDLETGLLYDAKIDPSVNLDDSDEIESILISIGDGVKDMITIEYEVNYDGSYPGEVMAYDVGTDTVDDIKVWMNVSPGKVEEGIPSIYNVSDERRKTLAEKGAQIGTFPSGAVFAGIIGEDDDVLEMRMLMEATGPISEADRGRAVAYYPDNRAYQVESYRQRDQRASTTIESSLEDEPTAEELSAMKL